MTATAHAVLGTVIAAKFGNPYLAVPLALVSHFAADLVPHWDAGTNRRKKSTERLFWESFIDVVAGFVVSYGIVTLLFPQTDLWYAFLIIIVAQLPDWLMSPYLFFKSKFPLFKMAYDSQKAFNSKLDKPWGIINQVAVVAGAIIFARSF